MSSADWRLGHPYSQTWAWHSSRQMNDLSFQKSPDKSQISYFLLCNYIGLFIPVARLESDRLLKHAQSLQLAGDKSHTILPGIFDTEIDGVR